MQSRFAILSLSSRFSNQGDPTMLGPVLVLVTIFAALSTFYRS